jgi:hypothetical protein
MAECQSFYFLRNLLQDAFMEFYHVKIPNKTLLRRIRKKSISPIEISGGKSAG